MRILQIAPPWFPVPPTGYGGIEWIVSSLADGLTALGQDVTLVANGDSETSAELVSVFDGSSPQRRGDVIYDAKECSRCESEPRFSEPDLSVLRFELVLDSLTDDSAHPLLDLHALGPREAQGARCVLRLCTVTMG